MKKIKTIERKIEKLNDLDDLPQSGIEIIRINSSYMGWPYNDIFNIEEVIKYIKNNYPNIKIQLELQGKKIKISNILKEDINIKKNSFFYFCSETYYVNNRNKDIQCTLIPITHYNLFKRSLVNYVYLKDNSEKLEVLEFEDESEILKIKTRENIIISKGKSVYAPCLKRDDYDLTAKDKEDLRWGLDIGIDIFSLSYCSSKNDIMEVKKYLSKLKKEHGIDREVPVWGKIEESQGMKNILDIINNCDGLVITDGYNHYEKESLYNMMKGCKLYKKIKRTKKDIIFPSNMLSEDIAKKFIHNKEEIRKDCDFLLVEQSETYKTCLIRKFINLIK